ncbi:UDP-N-acetylmuramoyl-tripeptide--D-alanyl-D-alanine ligase [Mucilaginibacter phyllosphaerae]|uniref:UDP-N-acetylmuramoyl-tripeptide--D-alanyl-D-alanine ligase n=1 Tax=Mucilaginibacter phyllosphaerae TaxID=1812349 RepID=A0A4Y8AE87_9SPHI|nr:UDP-N-acetylmuramoyl-tripeptide--D-alanyl-D-alanine ligase [Mucilaginibacter phyllosphaerae]MBB3970073.1 UDP-N-acetylmuramoyl-tripeptide--D-alanyl-D-alanine ligase [Mucilaginibacter phyllosphaerae]TEW66465.1 UDP-N-acetylmuramoyl-tripeptide--D-alanyl-D-alanine ligase [Mucilaginibacter phyllosphaerae]GGH09606.1 UDP-N-acetylmuramoyl-tripeptide--D-alanyl-D-alanine ligase [Mucilaginibacter phyllosphaerae]
MKTTTEELYQLFTQHPIISTDTRKIAPGSLFFALKGDKFDANTFAQQAIKAGAAYAVIDNKDYALSEQFLLVDDVLTALQNLARYHRGQLTIPVIGLTGTNGKTTTKELINAVLSQKFKTLATQGNLNNHIGVPLTILTIDRTHEMAVIEMGANHQKEIALLCTIARPTHGLITNVGKAHLEGFGGVEGVKKGKGELYDYLAQADDAVAFVNSDDKVLVEMQQARTLKNVIYYGKNSSPDNLVSGKLLDNSPLLTLKWHDKTSSSHNVQSQLTGSYNLDNILAAICIGRLFGLDSDEINQGIEGYQPKNNRSQIMKTATNILICDFYNANPSSMFVAIENMDKLQAARKVMILGDMFEMGAESAVEHTLVIQKALGAQVDERIFIGKDFSSQQTEVDNTNLIHTTFYLTAEDAMIGLKQNPISNATVLIKGSRGMALERLVELF